MKPRDVFLVLLLTVSSTVDAKVSSGLVGGAVAGAVAATVVSSNNKPKPQAVQTDKKLKIGRSILVCGIFKGRCVSGGVIYKNVYDLAGASGFKYIYSQTVVYNCSKSIDEVCLYLEVGN